MSPVPAAAVPLAVCNGPDIDPVQQGATSFRFAVLWSRFTEAKRLVLLGANVDFQDAAGRTARGSTGPMHVPSSRAISSRRNGIRTTGR